MMPKGTDPRVIDSMRSLVAEGAPRKALNLLLSDGLHSMDDPDVVKRLEELHPPGNHLRAAEVPGSVDLQLPDPQHIPSWSGPVLRGVADFPRGSAPGPSGLRPSCLYDMLKRGPHVSTLTESLAQFVALAAHGMFPADLAPPLASANLIPLRKPDGGVRPIAIGETLRRLVGKVLMGTPSLAKALRALAPQQCGVGIANACESIGQGLQDLVAAMPERGD